MGPTHLVTLLLVATAGLGSADTDEDRQKAVRMKTSRQLKEILSELGIEHDGLGKDELRELALQEDAVTRWEELHPEKKRKKSRAAASAFGKPPEGIDAATWERLMGQMKGDFSGCGSLSRHRLMLAIRRPSLAVRFCLRRCLAFRSPRRRRRAMQCRVLTCGREKDPERRRILEKLSKAGMSLGGGSDMDMDQLRQMEKVVDGLNDFKAGGAATPASGGAEEHVDFDKEEV